MFGSTIPLSPALAPVYIANCRSFNPNLWDFFVCFIVYKEKKMA